MIAVGTHEVTAAAVVLRTKAGSSQYIYQGAPLDADAFTEESVAHALAMGLIAEMEIAEAEVVEIELPKTTDSHDEIDAFAGKYSIDLSGLGDKPNRETKVAEIERVIERVIAERTAEAEASGVLQ